MIQPAQASRRIFILDTLRGFLLIHMLVYHLLFDLVAFYGWKLPWYTGMPGYLWEQFGCWGFIGISGVSTMLGHHPIRHGLVVLGCGVVVSLVTAVATPADAVHFGVLTFLGCASLLTTLLRPGLDRIPPKVGLALCAVLFVLTKAVPSGGLGLLNFRLLSLPTSWYSFYWLYPVGLPKRLFASSDYFPLIPWIFLFWCGRYLWQLSGSRVARTRAAGCSIQPFTWAGQNSLWIYMLHQPVLYGLLFLLSNIVHL